MLLVGRGLGIWRGLRKRKELFVSRVVSCKWWWFEFEVGMMVRG